MKSSFKIYSITWALLLALFNVFAFAFNDGYDTGFWVGYIFITIALLGQLICAYFAFEPDRLEKVFLNLPIVSVSFVSTIVSVIVGVICMAIEDFPIVIGITICYGCLAVGGIALLNATAAGEIVGGIDDEVRSKTSFIRTLTINAEILISSAKSPVGVAEAKKVYEAVKYSDPMSVEALANVESNIQYYFAQFANAVKNDQVELITAYSSELLNLITTRNLMCKSFK